MTDRWDPGWFSDFIYPFHENAECGANIQRAERIGLTKSPVHLCNHHFPHKNRSNALIESSQKNVYY